MTEIFNNDETFKDASEVEATTEMEPKYEDQEAECSKPKRRGRRGKKRRNKSQDSESAKFNEQNDSKKMGRNSKSNEGRKRQKLLIRPTDVPKAPENSTQFIIDDHDECHLYFSFETPNPYKEKVGSDSSDIFNDAALQDIDYEYESMQDLDNTAYYLQDFELSYSKVRYEETMRLTKPDLVSALENLEVRVRELEHKMYEKDPGSALEQLQRKLLRLQEENITLREEQQHLRKTVGEDSGSDDLLQDSGSEHLNNTDDEQDMNELSFESSDAFSVFDDNEDRENFSDSNNEEDYEDDHEFEHNSDESNNSVSSIIYGLHGEFENHPDVDEDFEEYENNELEFNQDSESSDFQTFNVVQSPTSVPNKLKEVSESEMLENNEFCSHVVKGYDSLVQEKTCDLNDEELLSSKEEFLDEECRENVTIKQSQEKDEGQLQEILNNTEGLNKNLNIKCVPDNSCSEMSLKMSNCQLDSVNNKLLQSNPSKLLSDNNEQTVKENTSVVKENTNVVKENTNVVKENANVVKENANVVKENTNVVNNQELPEHISKEQSNSVSEHLNKLSNETCNRSEPL